MIEQSDHAPIDSVRFGADADAHNRRLGMFVAWLGRMELFTPALAREAADGIASLRFETLTGAEFLGQYLRGTLRAGQLQPAARAFAAAFYASGEYERAIAAEPLYLDQPEWPVYARIAPIITAAWRRQAGLPDKPGAGSATASDGSPADRATARGSASILRFPSRPRRKR